MTLRAATPNIGGGRARFRREAPAPRDCIQCCPAWIRYAASELAYQWPVLGAIVGDTIKVHMPGLPHELQPVKIRVLGIDAPESGWCDG